MSALVLLRSLFTYQAWANDELLEKLASLDSHAHGKERHAAIRLLNHNLVVSKIFAAHLTGVRHGYSADNTEDTPALDALRTDVAAVDRWYLDYLETVAPDHLSEPVPFVFTDGDIDVAPGDADPCHHPWRLPSRRDRAPALADFHRTAMGHVRRSSPPDRAFAPPAGGDRATKRLIVIEVSA
ncbi:hypothetical protein GCM10007880_34870 [Mesorhizobium amorphae]|uniref:DinB family protein n=1 Tax=Mesorhizobium amorphae CCNWGS0123 TaxID=1082933 RepID=G6Y819_9HYPH|nr:DinB family protein [Mesorhizobium amorphae CCNWGS0123]GLR42971.1 hypothetical protein GCM10007880_34870 [Mesorhizobium amorphae]